ncbi:hypothetical protein [Pseudomonas sp.]|uniref:hypothetical protein n=1 Tax=Pseudomonas sp. TaxID=306 RepID=UPI002733E1B1|nr:hypothetical protein [Pseudomonas sp.]MDP3816613.1 hypothetical protein [Pseudomonas sp.]
MSKKNPHTIMGQTVQGTANQGYSLEIKHYDSTVINAYKPDAQAMLSELEEDIDRLRRVINARSHKLGKKLSENAS